MYNDKGSGVSLSFISAKGSTEGSGDTAKTQLPRLLVAPEATA